MMGVFSYPAAVGDPAYHVNIQFIKPFNIKLA
jgi:hypothetical protein